MRVGDDDAHRLARGEGGAQAAAAQLGGIDAVKARLAEWNVAPATYGLDVEWRGDQATFEQGFAGFAERAMPGETFCLLTPIDDAGTFGEALSPTLPAELAVLQAGHRSGEAWSPATVAAGGGERLSDHPSECDEWGGSVLE